MSDIGPALPPHLQKRRAATPEAEPKPQASPSVEEVGPALPPHILAARKAKAAQASTSIVTPPVAPLSSSESKKTYGPTLPAAGAAPPVSRTAYAEYDEEDDDDDVGPRPEMAYRGDQPGDAVREFLEREERVNKLREVRQAFLN